MLFRSPDSRVGETFDVVADRHHHMEMGERMRAEREVERGGSLGGSTEDSRDDRVHAELWRRIGSCSTTSVVPCRGPYSVPYSYEYQNFSTA